MAATLEQLEARRDALDKAIASGVLTIRHGDEQTTFRSMSEMMQARAFVQSQIDELQGKKRTRVRYAYQSGRGL